MASEGISDHVLKQRLEHLEAREKKLTSALVTLAAWIAASPVGVLSHEDFRSFVDIARNGEGPRRKP